MLKFLSKVVVEYCPLDPRKAAAVELLAQCNGRKAKDSNPACSVELRCQPSPPAGAEDPKSHPPPRVLVTYFNGVEEAFVAAEGATAQGIREQLPGLPRSLVADITSSFALLDKHYLTPIFTSQNGDENSDDDEDNITDQALRISKGPGDLEVHD
ncbi:hypothetical protein GUJ93_ZPchr0009g1938 [Zizania palustris]|uniref:Uncharacterized protein n=1 Tax=Zizania palustris TaxID=103762 RepID=A0A8J5S4K5_ZIZPA|nr:hypothetical protein GUJ93_ZPchr0009g1938 [Zizania palustris]